MQVEMSDSTTMARSSDHTLPISNIRWTAILAGLVVGLATHLLLMLLGAAIGLAAVDVGDDVSGAKVPLAVGGWNTLSMIISAFVGAYVAARSAGMRRASDGMLHGVVSWGLTLLLTALLASTALGSMMGNLFGSPTAQNAASRAAAAAGPAASQTARSIAEGDRAEAISSLQSRLGISSEQAGKLVDQALIMAGREEAASPAGQEAAQETLKTASLASGWLTAATLLSLLAAIAGGWLGSKGTHRVARTPVHRGPTHTDTPTTIAR